MHFDVFSSLPLTKGPCMHVPKWAETRRSIILLVLAQAAKVFFFFFSREQPSKWKVIVVQHSLWVQRLSDFSAILQPPFPHNDKFYASTFCGLLGLR
jgi:hypothetical protein